MLIINIISWAIVGLVLGTVWAIIAADRHIKVSEARVFGICGALVGGFAFFGSSVPGKYNVTALLTSLLGAVIFLFIDALISHRRPGPRAPIDQTASTD